MLPSLISPLSFEALANQPKVAAIVQSDLIRLGLLDPPADGQFGPFSKQALQAFQSLKGIAEAGFGEQTQKQLSLTSEVIALKLGDDLGSRIIRYMQAQNYFVALGKQRYNIVYIEGADPDGRPNADTADQWNDRRLVIELANGAPHIVGNWFATTEPGAGPTARPINAKGAARIAFGQYKAWQVDTHVGSSGFDPHEALVQVAPVKVHRDRNRDGLRTGDLIDEGLFGINQHWGYDSRVVGNASAGCLVGQDRNSHQDFMRLIKQDVRFQLRSNYVFMTTIIAGDDLARRFPA